MNLNVCCVCVTPDHVLGKKKPRKKNRRPVSSGDSCESGDEGERWGRRKRRRKLSQTTHNLDDGDEELYKFRMT